MPNVDLTGFAVDMAILFTAIYTLLKARMGIRFLRKMFY